MSAHGGEFAAGQVVEVEVDATLLEPRTGIQHLQLVQLVGPKIECVQVFDFACAGALISVTRAVTGSSGTSKDAKSSANSRGGQRRRSDEWHALGRCRESSHGDRQVRPRRSRAVAGTFGSRDILGGAVGRRECAGDPKPPLSPVTIRGAGRFTFVWTGYERWCTLDEPGSESHHSSLSRSPDAVTTTRPATSHQCRLARAPRTAPKG